MGTANGIGHPDIRALMTRDRPIDIQDPKPVVDSMDLHTNIQSSTVNCTVLSHLQTGCGHSFPTHSPGHPLTGKYPTGALPVK